MDGAAHRHAKCPLIAAGSVAAHACNIRDGARTLRCMCGHSRNCLELADCTRVCHVFQFPKPRISALSPCRQLFLCRSAVNGQIAYFGLIWIIASHTVIYPPSRSTSPSLHFAGATHSASAPQSHCTNSSAAELPAVTIKSIMQHAACGSCCHRHQQPWAHKSAHATPATAPASRSTDARHVVCALPARLAERHASKEAGRAAVAEEKAKSKGKQKGRGAPAQQQANALPVWPTTIATACPLATPGSIEV